MCLHTHREMKHIYIHIVKLTENSMFSYRTIEGGNNNCDNKIITEHV